MHYRSISVLLCTIVLFGLTGLVDGNIVSCSKDKDCTRAPSKGGLFNCAADRPKRSFCHPAGFCACITGTCDDQIGQCIELPTTTSSYTTTAATTSLTSTDSTSTAATETSATTTATTSLTTTDTTSSSSTGTTATTSLIGIAEPTRHLLVDGQTYDMTIQNCTFENDALEFTAFCYCWGAPDSDPECSVPGPSLVIYANSTVEITFHNELVGDADVQTENTNVRYKDIGITNIHTHGLHVDPAEDDVTIQIPPNGGAISYTFSIPEDHYPGSHWIHPHHHGCASFQISMGLFLMLMVEYDPETLAYRNQDVVLQYDNADQRMEDSVMMIQSVYAVNEEDCDCDNRAEYTQCVDLDKGCPNRDQLLDPNLVLSLCFEYCDFDEAQRSYYSYDMEADQSNYNYHLVNGLLEPTVTVYANEYHRLRLLNTNTQQTIQLTLPTECEWKLLALDGIYLQQGNPRDLVVEPYEGELVLFSATRADVAVKCSQTGTYDVVTSQEDLGYEGFNVHQLRRVDEGRVLFTVEVVEGTGNNVNDIESLVFPDKPPYLSNNCDDSVDAITVCPCARMNKDNMDRLDPDETDCIAAFGLNGGAYFNGITFDITTPINIWALDEVYEVTVYSAGHPYHQHAHPFQIETEENLFFGERCDWRDTYGYTNTNEGIFTLRTRPTDFTGVVIEHCHWLPHEDYGMMAWKYVTDNANELATCSVISEPAMGEVANDIRSDPSPYHNEYTLSNITKDNSTFYRTVIVLLCAVVFVLVSFNIVVCCIYVLNKHRNSTYVKVTPKEEA